MDDDRIKWDSRYAGNGFFIGPHPSAFLMDNMPLIASLCPGRMALDIACGEGRNSIFLAREGFDVTGLDISTEGLAKAVNRAEAEGVAATFLHADLDRYEFTGSWDLIINFNFLLRGLIPKMVAALSPGGIIVFDTILDSPSLVGHHTRSFLLQPGELEQLFSGFQGRILVSEEHPDGNAPTAKLIFRKN